LELTRNRCFLVLGDVAGLTSNLDSDVLIATEAMSMDGKVLSTIGVTLMVADVRDRWHKHGLVASAHVIRAMSCFCFSHLCVTDLPQHFYGLVGADWHVTNLSNNFVFIPAPEAVIIIYKELVIELGITYLSINEDHLIRFQISNEIQSLEWIEP
jgi:hypothetical protein